MKIIRSLFTATVISTIAITTPMAHARGQESATDTEAARTVAHADLDLTSPEGKRRLQLRIQHLVNELCPNDNLTSSSDRKRCREAAEKAASPQVLKAVSKAEVKKPFE